MAEVQWMIKAREFTNCNCAYGCPCQFNALPTHGHCQAVAGLEIEEGHHDKTRLDGLAAVSILRWPGAIHEGKGEAAVIIDERASEEQRRALLRILSGKDTELGATIFNVFATTLDKTHEPIFAKIDFKVDIDGRKARLVVPDIVEARGEPILNPVTGREHRVRIDMVGGFEYELAEIGRGWSKTSGTDQARAFGQLRSIRPSPPLPERHCCRGPNYSRTAGGAASLRRARVQGWISAFGVPADPIPASPAGRFY